MRITLIDEQGTRTYTHVTAEQSRVPGLVITRWYQTRRNRYLDEYSLTHRKSGRAMNKRPLSMGEIGQLENELLRSGIDFRERMEKLEDRIRMLTKMSDIAAELCQ